jgi:O-antigen ligase
VLYPLLAMVSTLWSVRPSWTFYKSVEYLVDLAAVAAVIAAVRSLQEYRKLVNWTWTLLGLLVATAWLGAIFDPADALLGGQTLGPLTVRLEGVMPSVDANSIGEICAILALVALNRMLNGPKVKQNRGWYAALFAVSLVTLFVSQTRAAMLAFVIGLALLLILLRRAWLVLAFGAVSGFAVLIALSFTNFGRTFSNFLLRGQSVQSVQGLSGRMDVWQASFDAFLQRPWTGYGGFAGSRFVVLPGIASQGSASSALSTYVDSMLDLGIWGPALLAVVVVAMVWFMFRATRGHYVRSADRPLAVEMFVVFAVILVRSVVTSNMVGHPALAFLTVVGFIEVARRQFAVAQRMEILRRAA